MAFGIIPESTHLGPDSSISIKRRFRLRIPSQSFGRTHIFAIADMRAVLMGLPHSVRERGYEEAVQDLGVKRPVL